MLLILISYNKNGRKNKEFSSSIYSENHWNIIEQAA